MLQLDKLPKLEKVVSFFLFFHLILHILKELTALKQERNMCSFESLFFPHGNLKPRYIILLCMFLLTIFRPATLLANLK